MNVNGHVYIVNRSEHVYLLKLYRLLRKNQPRQSVRGYIVFKLGGRY